jgi:hypothetical protein
VDFTRDQRIWLIALFKIVTSIPSEWASTEQLALGLSESIISNDDSRN